MIPTHFRLRVIVVIVLLASASVARAQTDAEKAAERVATRERLAAVLAASGPKKGIELTFARSEKNQFNFLAVKRGGFKNVEGWEIVVGVSDDRTIGFRIYPYFGGGYVNIDKAKNAQGLMRKMVTLNDHNFLYWGADDSGDIFAAYTFTLESGFPDKAIEIVLYSIAPLDQYVGDMRPMIDGSYAVK